MALLAKNIKSVPFGSTDFKSVDRVELHRSKKNPEPKIRRPPPRGASVAHGGNSAATVEYSLKR